MPRVLGSAVVLGVGAVVALYVLLHLLRPDYDPIRRFLSEYAVGRFGVLMTASFLLQALISLALVIGLFRDVRHSGSLLAGCAFLTVAAAALAVAGVFPTDLSDQPGDQPRLTTRTGMVHQSAGTLSFSPAWLLPLSFPAPIDSTARWASPRTDGPPSRGRIHCALYVCIRGSVGFGRLGSARNGCCRSALDVPERSGPTQASSAVGESRYLTVAMSEARYDRIGVGMQYRRPDEGCEADGRCAGSARSVLNVGAGTGSVRTDESLRGRGGPRLAEMRRIARDRVVIFTWDPEHPGFWLVQDYLPEFLVVDRPNFPSLRNIEKAMGATGVHAVPIPADCYRCRNWTSAIVWSSRDAPESG